MSAWGGGWSSFYPACLPGGGGGLASFYPACLPGGGGWSSFYPACLPGGGAGHLSIQRVCLGGGGGGLASFYPACLPGGGLVIFLSSLSAWGGGGLASFYPACLPEGGGGWYQKSETPFCQIEGSIVRRLTDLTLSVECHHYHGCTISSNQLGFAKKVILPFLERYAVHNALSLCTLQPCLNYLR